MEEKHCCSSAQKKTALMDCGMAYCGEALAENIKQKLGERPLDYVILSPYPLRPYRRPAVSKESLAGADLIRRRIRKKGAGKRFCPEADRNHVEIGLEALC